MLSFKKDKFKKVGGDQEGTAAHERNESAAEKKAEGDGVGPDHPHHKGGEGFHQIKHNSGHTHSISHHDDGIHHSIHHPDHGAHHLTHSPGEKSNIAEYSNEDMEGGENLSGERGVMDGGY